MPSQGKKEYHRWQALPSNHSAVSDARYGPSLPSVSLLSE
jgi:hypothetical protein